MFNSYNVRTGGMTTNTSINAVSGTLLKNHPKSFIKRFHLTSQYADNVLSDKPFIKGKYSMGKHEEVPVVVLQVMLAGEGILVAEIVRESEYDINYEENAE